MLSSGTASVSDLRLIFVCQPFVCRAHAQPLDTADNLHLSASNRSKTYHDAPSFGYMPQLAREGQHGRLNFEDHLGLVRAWNNLQGIWCLCNWLPVMSTSRTSDMLETLTVRACSVLCIIS